MKQYCRYCTYLIYGDVAYCRKFEKTMRDSTAKSINNCKDFDFNEIDAFGGDKPYTPRKKALSKKW